MNFSHFGQTIHVAECFAQPIKTRVSRDTLESLEVGTYLLPKTSRRHSKSAAFITALYLNSRIE